LAHIAPLSLAVLLFPVVCVVLFGFLIWYALRHKDFVRAKFARGKTSFELEAGKNAPHEKPTLSA
jgi:hypothetical protein